MGIVLSFNKLTKRKCKANANSKDLSFLKNTLFNKTSLLKKN